MNKIDFRRKAILIIECDSTQLERDDLALGNHFYNLVKPVFYTNLISLVRSYTEANLLDEFGKLYELEKPYRSVVIIGHSNKDGLQISSDRFIDWDGVANWLEPFEPRQIILLACNAGSWLPCVSLFKGIPTLKEIFGSPVPVHKNEVYVTLLRVLHILGAKREDFDLVQLLQIGNFLATSGLMFRRTRAEFERSGEVEGIFWNLAEPQINRFIEELRKAKMY